jgi:DNA ligase-1
VTLFAELATTSEQVAATSSRTAKINALAGLLRRLQPGEVEAAVALLSGEPRQGRIGVGWATLASVAVDPASEPSITVAEVDATIDRLAALEGPGSNAARTATLAELLRRATAPEADLFRQLLTGQLRQGALGGVMADAAARAAGVPLTALRRAAMLAGDLPKVAAVALERGLEGLAEIGLRPLTPVLPMLAASSPDVASAIEECGRSSVEWKLDGARIQVHRDGDDVRIFTRNLNDVTSRLPGIAAVAMNLPARCVILDGEALGFLEDDAQRPDRFQEVMSRFGSHGPSDGLAARFFDILHLDGDDLLDEPLSERAAVLDRVVGPWRIPSIATDDPTEAAAFFDAAVAAGHEGVMVKALDSRYEAGRRGGAWRKVKPVQTFDLVVLGAEWGHGRRQGWLSNLHLGARDPQTGGFVMVGKTFKGLTDELLRWQTEQLLAREVRRSGITVFVRPEVVVEIALDGVQSSTRYPGGLALRFARVKRYRPDKTPAEADIIESLQALL